MRSINTKIWGIAAIGAVVGLVGALYLSREVGARGERRVVTTQLDEWAAVWRDLRACLVGDGAKASDGRDAAMLRLAKTASDPSAELTVCDRQYLRKLVRPGAEQTGVPEIEAAWGAIKQATSQLGRAFAGVLDRESLASPVERWDKLGRAIARMDTAYVALRSASKVDPDPPPGGALPELPRGDAIRGDGGAPLVVADANADNELLLIDSVAADDGSRSIAIVRGPDTADVRTIWPNRLPAVGDEAWGLWFTRKASARGDAITLRAGALPGPPGAPDTDESAGTVIASTRAATEDLSALFALAGGDRRAVYYQRFVEAQPPALMVATSTDGGVSFGKSRVLAAGIVWPFPDAARDRFDVVWQSEQGEAMWVPATPGDPAPAPRVLFPAPFGIGSLARCVSAGAAWWLRDDGEVFRAGATGAAEPMGTAEPGQRIAGCDDRRVALAGPGDEGPEVWVCEAGSCAIAAAIPTVGEVEYAVALTPSGPVALSTTGHIAILWRAGEQAEDGEAVFRLAEDAGELRSLHHWDGKLYAAFQGEAGATMSLVPIP